MKNLYVLSAVIILLGAGCVPVVSDQAGGTWQKLELNNSTAVNMSNQGLTEFPKDLLDQTQIEELDLSGNNLTGAMPAEIRHLQNLRVLDISDNNFDALPAEVGQLKKLEVLDVSNNYLTGLPYEIGDLPNLRLFDLSGNNVHEVDLNIIKKGLGADTEIRE